MSNLTKKELLLGEDMLLLGGAIGFIFGIALIGIIMIILMTI